MAIVQRQEFLDLFNFVREKLKAERKIELENFARKELYFEEISLAIKEYTGVYIRASTLYKSYYLDMYKSKEYEVTVSEKNANALSRYAHNQKYDARYTMGTGRALFNTTFDSDPEMAEYPAINPSFPATPLIPIELGKQFNNLIIHIKDESHNELIKTHKSRSAWEIFLFAKKYILEKYKHNEKAIKFRASVVSSGNFALAVFARLKIQSIPFELNIVIDENIINSQDSKLKLKHEQLNGVMKVAEKFPENLKVFPYDLKKKLTSKKLLEITNNLDGVDLTFSDSILKLKGTYFDWLSMEILSASPDFIFLPFGGGELLENILETLIDELQKPKGRKSKRYFGYDDVLKNCNFYGLTTTDQYSVFHRLFVYKDLHPMNEFLDKKIPRYHKEGINGKIEIHSEDYFDSSSELNNLITQAKSIFESNHIKCEPSGLAGMVLFLKFYHDEPNQFKNKKIIVVNTGSGDWNFLLSEEFEALIK